MVEMRGIEPAPSAFLDNPAKQRVYESSFILFVLFVDKLCTSLYPILTVLSTPFPRSQHHPFKP